MKRILIIILTLVFSVLIFSCTGKRNPAAPLAALPTAAAGSTTATLTITSTSAYSPIITATNTFSPVISSTNTCSPVVTATNTPSPAATLTASTTKIITATNTVTITSTSTVTQTATNTVSVPVSPTLNATPPASMVKLIFIHHSTGQNWLESGYGSLGTALNANNYFVSDTNYGWSDPGYDQGSSTDTVNWPEWFRDEVMPFVFAENANSCYTNTLTEPAGENEIIMFKSCFPNSEVGSDITDEQAIYNSLLPYMAGHTDKLFILIIPPPMQVISDPAATRELSEWLYDRQNGWLKNYTHGNVYAYDYYNVLTHPDNHHTLANGFESHKVNNAQNTLYYPTGNDDHPSVEGQQKAASEFVPLLNAWYRQWKGL